MNINVGDRIYFSEERYPYTVQACDERYLICTKPFNPRHTVQYTIVDLKNGIRGADNYWKWGGYFDYSKHEECELALKALNGGLGDQYKPFEISRRNYVKLNITRYASKEDSKAT